IGRKRGYSVAFG
nr:Chain B, A28NLS [synthetic construct]3ZIO_C Chain C, A28NLS [synthetic construct]